MVGLHKSAQAAEQLIANNLHSRDQVGIFTASGTTSIDFTGDRELLLAALARLRPMYRASLTPAESAPISGVALILDIDFKLREQPAVVGEVSILQQAPNGH